MIGKEQKLVISRTMEKYNKASIKLDSTNIDPDTPEIMGYLLVEAMGAFLSDVRKVLPKWQEKLYNEYVQDLYEEMKKVLIAKYEDG